MNLASRRLRRGSFKEKLSQNGNRLDRVRFCGSTGSVSCCLAVTLLQTLMSITVCSWRREECVLVH